MRKSWRLQCLGPEHLALLVLSQASQVVPILQNQSWPDPQAAASQQQATTEQSNLYLSCRFWSAQSSRTEQVVPQLPILVCSLAQHRGASCLRMCLPQCAHPMNDVVAVQEGHRAGHLKRSHSNGTIVRAPLGGVPTCAKPTLHHSVLHNSCEQSA